jgi:hypothetical protein
VPGLLTAAIAFGTSWLPNCRTIPDWRAWCWARGPGGRGVGRGGGGVRGARGAGVTCGSLLGLLPHRIVQIAVAAVFLAGAVLVLREDKDDVDEVRLKAGAAGFWHGWRPLTSSRHPCQTCAVSSSPRSASTSPQTAVAASTPAPVNRAAQAQFSGKTVADEQPSSRHHDVPQAEDRGHFQSGQPVHTADPDGDCRPEVVQPEREGDH